ncbi:hypothetical protein GCM10010521_64800 [Streptomyces rameus]|uniref:Peroxiredoxin n=2 Tax=Streptomyces TaxID=1883 RepID=A0ABP6HIU5_9ACTN
MLLERGWSYDRAAAQLTRLDPGPPDEGGPAGRLAPEGDGPRERHGTRAALPCMRMELWRADYASVMAKKLVIKVTAGADAPERCSQAFTVAAVAVASGVEVSLWLTGESSWFALPGRAAEFELPHAAPLPDLIGSILAAGRITLCTQCAARREITEKDVIEGVRIAGAQVFVQEALADGAQALVY